MTSPLGKYAAAAAALTCVGTIGVYLLALVLGSRLAIDAAAVSQLHDLAILAFGAVVGSAVAVNGYKQPVTAIGEKVDQLRTDLSAVATLATETHATVHGEPSVIVAAAAPSPDDLPVDE